MVLAAITAAISFVPRAVAEEKPAAKQAAAKGSGAAPAQDRSEEYYLQAGEADMPPSSGPSGFIPLPAGAYSDLGSADVRRHYHLSSDQEKKLVAISQDFQPRLQELQKNAAKELANLPPQQLPAKQAEFGKRWREETLACHNKIEKVLTKEQVAAYKHDTMGSYARSVDPTVARHNAARTQPPTGSAVATAD